jgi:phosphoribosylformylglycinamidine synthase subunit PurQ / glutaminase
VFPGTWSDCDFHYVISEVLHEPVKYVWHRDRNLADLDCVILPGGFSYGDYLRAGAVAGKSPVVEALGEFVAGGGYVLGSCNGFQILCEAGLLPGALVRNRGLEFRCDWVHMRVETDETPWTAGLRGEILRMPIAHGEGCWVADDKTLADVESRRQVVFRYTDERGGATAAGNPNGSLANIAGVCNEGRNVVGLMPHPERCSETLLGGTDGYRLLANLAPTLAGTTPAVYR